MIYDGASSSDLIVLEIEILQGLHTCKSCTDFLSTGGSELIPLKVQTFDIGALLEVLCKDLNADIRNLVEGQIDVPNEFLVTFQCRGEQNDVSV